MSTRRSDLFKILQLGTIKVVPGVFNLALVPYLVFAMGASAYGDYSLLLSYALLVAAVVGAIVTQPMYRFLSSCPDDVNLFNSFMYSAAAFCSVVTFGVVFIGSGQWLYALGFALFGAGVVTFGAFSVRFQIEGQTGRLACFELLRVFSFLISLVVQWAAFNTLDIGHVIVAIAASFLVPQAVFARGLKMAHPSLRWLKDTASFGTKSAIWIFLAGVPMLATKSILSTSVSDVEFGYYAAFADIAYRGFSILNAAIIMWMFPLVSRAYDDALHNRVKQLLGFALGTYAAVGISLIGTAIFIAYLQDLWVAPFSSGLLAVSTIMLSSFFWQTMSIAHKPFELAMQTTKIVVLMLAAIAVFAGLAFALVRVIGLDPIVGLSLALSISGMCYACCCFIMKPKIPLLSSEP